MYGMQHESYHKYTEHKFRTIIHDLTYNPLHIGPCEGR